MVVAGAVARSSVWIYCRSFVYTEGVAKHLVDIDEHALRTARHELGTKTIKDTVNLALRRVSADDQTAEVQRRLDVLAGIELAPREQAWR